jgi:hypothetical protein
MSIDDGIRITREQILDMIENRAYNLLVTPEEGRIIRKLINKELEVEKETSIESLIEHAKKLKKFALEMCPKDVGNLDVYVDEDSKKVNFVYKTGDPFWNRMHETQVLLKFFASENKSEKDKVSRRIYV